MVPKDLRFFNIFDNELKILKKSGAYSVFPIGLKGRDTLIVFSNNTEETGHPPGYCFMDLNGNYLSMINNPNFEYITRGGIRKKGQWNLNWNEKYGLFVYTEDDSTIQGYRISVTDLYGNYYRSYTSGDYFDDQSVWGPDGDFILFSRGGNRIMIIDVATGEVSDFLKQGDIPGAVVFQHPDY